MPLSVRSEGDRQRRAQGHRLDLPGAGAARMARLRNAEPGATTQGRLNVRIPKSRSWWLVPSCACSFLGQRSVFNYGL